MRVVRSLTGTVAGLAFISTAACSGDGGSEAQGGDELTVAFPVPLTSGNSTITNEIVNADGGASSIPDDEG